nr:uncharacterized protein LOC123775281 [Procambarus clarkii]
MKGWLAVVTVLLAMTTMASGRHRLKTDFAAWRVADANKGIGYKERTSAAQDYGYIWKASHAGKDYGGNRREAQDYNARMNVAQTLKRYMFGVPVKYPELKLAPRKPQVT